MLALPNEIWRDIPGFEGFYQASSTGRIRSIDRTVFVERDRTGKTRKQASYSYTVPGKVLVPIITWDGYKTVGISVSGVTKIMKVHRLVAFTFIPNPLNLPEVNHKDENKLNCSISNLEWCTKSYNANFGTRNIRFGKNKSKKIVQLKLDGTLIAEWDSVKSASESLGIERTGISACLKGRYKSSGGYIWKYA